MTVPTLLHPALELDHGDQDAIAVEVCIDEGGAAGDVVVPLAKLLIDLARKRRAAPQSAALKLIPSSPPLPNERSPS